MSSLKVLYVHDEADIREIASLSLELDPDITVRCESSGAGAADRTRAVPKPRKPLQQAHTLKKRPRAGFP